MKKPSFEHLPLEKLNALRWTKEKLAKYMNLPSTGVDYALPQQWLNAFSKYAEQESKGKVAYDSILGTTFMVYHQGDAFGSIVTGCMEVDELLKKYNRR